MIVALAVAASASASTGSVKKVAAGDLPRVQPSVGLQRLAARDLGPLVAGTADSAAAHSASSRPKGASDIFYDGFEGSVGHWYLAGDPTWGFWDARPAVGVWSAYCAGSPTEWLGLYFNDMLAEMWTDQIDLSSLTSARLDYKLWLDSEYNYDWLGVLVSADGFQTYGGWFYSGNSQGWVDDFIDLADVPDLGSVCGQSNVTIEFLFMSDSSNVAEGAYVDEIRVSNPPKPVVVAMTALPGTVGYNKPVSIAGSLTSGSGTLLPNRPVDLYTSLDGTNFDFHSTLTSVTGDYTTTVPIVRRTYFWLWFQGDSEHEEGSSAIVKVMARAKLVPPAFSKTVRRGVRVTEWGSLRPQHSAAANAVNHTKASFYRYFNGKWRFVATLWAKAYRNTTSATQYKIVVPSFGKTGKWRVRAIHQDADHAKTTSAWRYFRVV
jgi:hypothetical protein